MRKGSFFFLRLNDAHEERREEAGKKCNSLQFSGSFA